MNDSFIPPPPPPRPKESRDVKPVTHYPDGKPIGDRPQKGSKAGFNRSLQGATERKMWFRDDLWALAKAKSKREKRTLRSVVEGALYWFLFESEGHNLPHPDDPALASQNPKHKNTHIETEKLDRG